MKKLLYLIVASILVACGSSKDMKVRMHTTLGVIDFCLYDETPKHKENFSNLSRNNNTILCFSIV